jgi:transaldolase/glucose-6-phosphate isomerase
LTDQLFNEEIPNVNSAKLSPAAGSNPLQDLQKYGQSAWLDYIRRNLIASGELKRMVDEDGLGGVTSNPAIFEKAITGSTDYTEALVELQKEKGLDAKAIYERLAIRDIQDAADVLRPVYERSNRRDGYVSFEVSPFLAKDTAGTLKEARRLWQAVNRPNLMVKIPATPEGIPAIEQAIGEGMNINVTLLFAQDMYEKVARAYIAGLDKWVASGGDAGRVASVASVFVSRIDGMVDGMLKARLKTSADVKEQALLRSLLGKVAIANAKLTYQAYKSLFSGPMWQKLAKSGAQTQRVLWASTGTKDPGYSDVLYVDELIGPDTVNTIPPATFDAFRDHGKPRASLESDLDAAHDVMETLAAVGISISRVTDELIAQAVKMFAEPFDKLLNAVDAKCKVVAAGSVDPQTYSLPADLEAQLAEAVEDWKLSGKVRRLWARDASLWTGSDEGRWLGWLGITEDQLASRERFSVLAADILSGGYKHALLLGMGGSSLGPEVLKMTFGKIDGYPELLVLDSTDPAQVKAFENKIDLAKTIFVVSSKSGSTLEPNILKQYFFERVKEVIGAEAAGRRFIAVTDPGSKLERVAEGDGFRHIYHGLASIGGRYSALSDFGMVPAAIMGMDAPRFLDQADTMAIACSSCLPADRNPGAVLGLILGLAARWGRDKVTLVTSPPIRSFGAWLEQLLAESSGKEGKGMIPVDREPLGKPEVYGHDRVFAYVRTDTGSDPAQDVAIDALARAGHPVIRIALGDLYQLGQEMFRWEIATAVACSVLGVNAFNQPDVEASKLATKKLTSEYERTGSLPPETPILTDSGIQLYADPKNAAALAQAAGSNKTLIGYLRAHFDRIGRGDYFALLAYVEMNAAHEDLLQSIRARLRDARRVATCCEFGPRFLHSTGQAYKGGPNSGVFLQVTCDNPKDLAVPGQKYTFGVVKAAQARGDFEVLIERDRRALRVHLKDPVQGLAILKAAVDKALS